MILNYSMQPILIDVPVHNVRLVGQTSIDVAAVNDIFVDLQVTVGNRGQSVTGNDLWRVSMWASSNPDGSGSKIGLTNQVRTSKKMTGFLINTTPMLKIFTWHIENGQKIKQNKTKQNKTNKQKYSQIINKACQQTCQKRLFAESDVL